MLTGLKRLRQKAGLTQKELSALCGVAYQNISAMECGRYPNPTVDTMIRLCKHLGVGLNALVGMNDKGQIIQDSEAA